MLAARKAEAMRREKTAQAGCPRTSHGAGHTLAGLSHEEIDAALEGLPLAPEPLGTAASASLSGIGKQDLDADMDY